MEKTCQECGKRKLVEDFYPDPRMADGHKSCCKECVKARTRARYWQHSEYERERKRREYHNTIEYQRARRKAWRQQRKEADRVSGTR